MKKRFIKAGIISVLLVCGLLLASCDNSSSGGSPDPCSCPYPGLPAPTGLTVTGVTSNSVSLKWNAVFGATGYDVYRNQDGGTTYYWKGETTGLTYTDTGLSPNTKYWYAVNAFKGTYGTASYEESNLSSPVSVTTPGGGKTIVISNFSGSYNGKIAMLTLHTPSNLNNVVAVGGLQISGYPSSLTFSLKTDSSLAYNWNGSGSYIILLSIGGSNIENVFTYGSGGYAYSYSITQATTTISFTNFINVPLTSVKTMPSFESVKKALIP